MIQELKELAHEEPDFNDLQLEEPGFKQDPLLDEQELKLTGQEDPKPEETDLEIYGPKDCRAGRAKLLRARTLRSKARRIIV